MKHANIAVFVPHNGCPHRCSFCDQRSITGQQYQPEPEDIISAVQTAEKSLGSRLREAEIAFFGGSFTAIDREYMLRLLKAASVYVKSGKVYGIRISTRPDAIDNEILDILSEHGVTTIELGAQSMDNNVLLLNERGHTAEDVIKASRLISEHGFSLGLQMMTGLYGSSDDIDRKTAEMIAALHPDTVRIYPTVVMKNTRLSRLFESGEYFPPTYEKAVPLCAELLRYFEDRGICVIRLGLHDSESLRSGMVGGAFHPAFRELCESRIMLENTLNKLKELDISSGEITIAVAPSSVSRMVGQKRGNLLYLHERGIEARVEQDSDLSKYEIRLTVKNKNNNNEVV